MNPLWIVLWVVVVLGSLVILIVGFGVLSILFYTVRGAVREARHPALPVNNVVNTYKGVPDDTNV